MLALEFVVLPLNKDADPRLSRPRDIERMIAAVVVRAAEAEAKAG